MEDVLYNPSLQGQRTNLTKQTKTHCNQSHTKLDMVLTWAYDSIQIKIDLQQNGNMKSSSTTHCPFSIFDFIYQRLDSWKASAVLAFTDFHKAFDLVVHSTVIKKALAWLGA